jgi:carbon starvation protein
LWAAFLNERNFIADKQWILVGINAIVIVLALWVVVEGAISLAAARRSCEDAGD